MIIPPRLHAGDTIGLASPSWLATEEDYRPIIAALEGMGFCVKCARNLFASGWGYAASDRERADDLNQLICDDDVRMVFFGGGEGADDVLPLLDYQAAAAHPKLYLSYSDGTSILNAIWVHTGLVTYYGQMPGLMTALSSYNREQLQRCIIAQADRHLPSGPWHTIIPGTARGTLMGGYLGNMLFLAGSGRIPLKNEQRYVLFLEEHQRFCGIEHLSAQLAQLEQMPLMPHVAGLLFGHYAAPVNPYLLQRLQRLGEKWCIPVAYCDDFGHGEHHAILPIGAQAALDTRQHTLTYSFPL